ncbi:hypothetical protein PFISCL1PPCAC_24617, partial [Pristionchus fissidentatus]
KTGTVSRSRRAYQPGPVSLKDGLVVGSKWKVIKKLGAGGCGAVYAVEDVNAPKKKAALKAESNFVAGGSVLKIEVEILKRLKGRDHIATLLGSGKLEKYQYMVMTLLGECLCNLIRKRGRSTISTQTRIGLQVLQGLKIVHDIGFVHRDIKPSNLALGRQGKSAHVIHILDFGLSREYVITQGVTVMRRPRARALFRGTARYASVATHDKIEQGRHDDLWSLLFVMAECRNRLPWASIIMKTDVVEKKRSTADNVLLKDCPIQLLNFAEHLRTLTYYLRPDYELLYNVLMDIMIEGEYKFSDPWDWEKETTQKTLKSAEETQHTQEEELEWAIDPDIFKLNPFGF